MRANAVAIPLVGLLLGSSAAAQSPALVDGVCGVWPAREGSCLAVELQLPEGQALAGVRWLHNDGAVSFPGILVVAGTAGGVPDLTAERGRIEAASGPSLGWAEAALASSVTDAGRGLFAVFLFPPGEVRSGEGAGGGPGIGYWKEEGGTRAWASPNGTTWIPIHRGYRMAVEAVVFTGEGLSAQGGASSSTSVRAEGGAPVTKTELLPPQPNPSNPSARVAFALKEPGRVRLEVVDLRGRRIRELYAGALPAGWHHIRWSGEDARGVRVSSGVYVVRLEVDGQVFQRRLALVR